MFIKNEKDFSQIEVNLEYDRSNVDNMDNTLMKYFLPEDNLIAKEEKEIKNKMKTGEHNNLYDTSRKLLSEQKIEKFFGKQIKLRNALKQCYWDRQGFIYPNSTTGPEQTKMV